MSQEWLDLCERQTRNSRIEGVGLDTTTVLPCPFCGAADWMRFGIAAGLTEYAEQQKEHVCKECKRGGRLVMTQDGGTLTTELRQTSGNDLPAWFALRVTRESPACYYCRAAPATQKVVWKQGWLGKEGGKLDFPWCGCDLHSALVKKFGAAGPVREGIDYEVKPL